MSGRSSSDKREACEYADPSDEDCAPAYRNFYECDDCNVNWEDHWISPKAESVCPQCGESIEAFKSVIVGGCACDVL